MVCLFHGDYGPPDPAFTVFAAAGAAVHGWTVDPHLLKDAHNIGEAEAIQRHVLKGEPVSWCHQGYAWVDQDAIGWFYLAAFVFVVLPYLVIKIRTLRLRLGSGNTPRRLPEASSRLPS
jgi:hypothetical protein